MRLRLLLPPLAAALLAGCLKEGRPVLGRFLVPGRAVEKPAFVKQGGAVTYELRRRKAQGDVSGAYDWAIVNYDTAETRTLVENVSDRWGRQDNGNGLYYVMSDEALAPGRTTWTLDQVDLDQGILERI